MELDKLAGTAFGLVTSAAGTLLAAPTMVRYSVGLLKGEETIYAGEKMGVPLGTAIGLLALIGACAEPMITGTNNIREGIKESLSSLPLLPLQFVSGGFELGRIYQERIKE
jgi:hypothetical protein